MQINLTSITDRQILELGRSLLDYEYIQAHCSTPNDKDFQDVYYRFYLKARYAQVGKKGGANCTAYFNTLDKTTGKDALGTVLQNLKTQGASSVLEFSIGSKLLHTKNTTSPIYDSKVAKYLKNDEGLDLWWGKALKKEQTKYQQFQHDWGMIKDWYDNFIKNDQRYTQWITWFDGKFPQHKNISDVKKIDFLIFIFN